jgi:hypothetical protein
MISQVKTRAVHIRNWGMSELDQKSSIWFLSCKCFTIILLFHLVSLGLVLWRLDKLETVAVFRFFTSDGMSCQPLVRGLCNSRESGIVKSWCLVILCTLAHDAKLRHSLEKMKKDKLRRSLERISECVGSFTPVQCHLWSIVLFLLSFIAWNTLSWLFARLTPCLFSDQHIIFAHIYEVQCDVLIYVYIR